jgi:hypothetical protein
MQTEASEKPKTGETRATPWIAYGHYGYTHYRIWDRFTNFGMMQRHEWRHEDGTEELQNWIPTIRNEWCKDAQPITDAALTDLPL